MEASFSINGIAYKVTPNSVPIETTLNTFIRQYAELTGTKFLCLEGGCGLCIVTLKGVHPITKEPRIWAANSCLTFVYACHGLDIFTIESLGDRTNPHPLQKRLTDSNGTQCGFCTSGMIMNMYSLLESQKGNVTMDKIENSFGGNICRCTGYRPILDAFKSFAVDSGTRTKDIEELPKFCSKTNSTCKRSCSAPTMCFKFDDNKEWIRVLTIPMLFDVFMKIGQRSYMLVAGNTAHGVYRRDTDLKVFININEIEQLKSYSIEENEISIGGSVSLTDIMDILEKASKLNGYEYCKHLVRHIDLIANVPVRNNGTIAGNLCIKHQHHEFPSDLFLILETCMATITIAESITRSINISVAEFLNVDLKKKIILKVVLPKLLPNEFIFRSYKIMPRSQNAHAYVNAGFLFKIHGDHIVETARICFGGISPTFIHAQKTEELLKGQNLCTNETLRKSLETLNDELKPNRNLPDTAPEHRKQLALSLFYKAILSICPSNRIHPKYISGGAILERPISSGLQSFYTIEKNWPLTQPIVKYEGLSQCTGEAKYTNDMGPGKDELWAAFVLAIRPNEKISNIDASDALKIPGIYGFFSAQDIPGTNNFSPSLVFVTEPEEIFVGVNSEVIFYGQPVGIILAVSNELANMASKLVKISYTGDNKKPIVPTIIEKRHPSKQEPLIHKENVSGTKNKIIKGQIQIDSQYHFPMEPHTTVCVPGENGEIDVYSATQWMDHVQIAVAECLNISANKVNISVRRLGGAFGTKITRATQVACACAIGCWLTKRPVRLVLSIESNIMCIGRRAPIVNNYEVEINENGKIHKLHCSNIEDCGASLNESSAPLLDLFLANCYARNETWTSTLETIKTNAPSHSWFRAPGSCQAISIIENIMEHISRAVGRDSIDVRMENISDEITRKMLPEFLDDIDFRKRRNDIDKFNSLNRWRKKGIAVIPMKYPVFYVGPLPAYVTIYHQDGTVAISHGGIECGQGMNSKVAQVAAHILGIPYDFISIKPSNNLIGANATFTGASITTEGICHAVKLACEELLSRIKPVRDELKTASWPEITSECNRRFINLSAQYQSSPNDVDKYEVLSFACAEIEIDILTGCTQITRADILEDAGESMNPLLDVGQVEGGFVMGISTWLYENLIYDWETGALLTNRTWNYKTAGAKDIPIDFRVKFLKNNKNPIGVLRSKATGEPPLTMAYVVVLALRYALDSARENAGLKLSHYDLDCPSTRDILLLASGNSMNEFKLS